MLDLRILYFEDLSVGMTETLSKTVASSDVVGFAQLTGDRNPIHLSEHFAAKTTFGGRIAHGLYTASLISAVLGTRLPGPGAIYISQSLNFRDNDLKMAQYLGGVLDRIATAMKPTIKGNVNVRRGNYNVVPYQSTHNTGGTMMGADPKGSAVNRYCQAWDADNLFVMGASLFPQNASYNPTGLVGALAYWSAEAITTKYLKNPGPLVPA